MKISKRHKRPVLTTKVTRRITDIPRHDWDSVFPNLPHILEGYDFFKTLDESDIKQFSFYYMMVHDRKRAVGATVCFLFDYSLDTSINGPLRRLTNSIKKIAPNIFSIKAVVCGMPIGQGRIGAGGNEGAVLKAIIHRMEQLAKKNRAPVIAFKDFDRTYTRLLDPLQREGFAKFDSLPTTMLNVWFKDFEEYLNTLSAASRYDLRRKFRRVDGQVKIDIEIVDELDEAMLQEAYSLYLGMVAKHEMGFELLPIEFFRKIPKNMSGHTKFFLSRIDGKLVMFLFCLVSKDIFIDYYVGFDYSIALKYHLYFIKFRETLNYCIKHKIKLYEMGITGYEPKRRLGFDFIPLYLYAKLRNPVFRPVFNFICQFLKFENFDPSLKKAKGNKTP